MILSELAKNIRFDNASKGFDPLEGGLDRYLLLVCSEICEAQDELRDGRGLTEVYYIAVEITDYNSANPPGPEDIKYTRKPCGFPVELADAAIRILDIQAKLEYNIRLLNGNYDFDPRKTIESELLAIVSTVSHCFRPE